MNGSPGTPKRRRSGEVSSPSDPPLNLKEEPVLIPLLEDLSEWLTGNLSVDITPENFIDLFENGVLLCQLAAVLHDKAIEHKGRTSHCLPLPSNRVKKWYENPKTGSFFCRDNVCKFINWCKQFGVSDICLFESNDMVEHRNVRALRNVLVCLLDVGKIGVRHGIEPSELVRMDLEIDREMELERKKPTVISQSTNSTPVVPDTPRRRKSRIPRKNSSMGSSLASSSEPASSEDDQRPLSSPEPDEEELERIRIKLLSLDEQVHVPISSFFLAEIIFMSLVNANVLCSFLNMVSVVKLWSC